jgi:hypothetical protein
MNLTLGALVGGGSVVFLQRFSAAAHPAAAGATKA